MPSITTLNAADPVSKLIDRSTLQSGLFPVPLIATSYDITLAGGLACVTARRTFRNQEAGTIEATLTFPLPVHAVLHGLEARIGDRVVKAVAKDKSAARQTYEDAIDGGRPAVLHEELLRGIHMLSIAHVAPGKEIEVVARFALALCWVGGRATLRIPLTVSDVYSASGLADCDDLAHGGPTSAAEIKVVCEPGSSATIRGLPLGEGRRVPLDRPIVIEVHGWTARPVRGRTATGKIINLAITPVAEGDADLDAAFLIDHSGSMSDTCTSGARVSKHMAVMLGLNDAARSLRDADRINLWEFDDAADDLGTAHGSHITDLIQMLSGPDGGTEIGAAIKTLLEHRRVRDVVLVTDGKSHALDVQELAVRGVRFSVVLIGDDSLEANVGHLAALTGGEIFVASGADVAAALKSVLTSLRAARPDELEGLHGVHLGRGRQAGMQILATPELADATFNEEMPDVERAAGAFTASLRLAKLPAAEAAEMAVAEGLVTHLTSLVLVDEEGAAQVGLPAMRKIALPSPATHVRPPALQLSRTPAMMSVDCVGARQSFSHGQSKSMVFGLRRSAASRVVCAMDDDEPRSRSVLPSRRASCSAEPREPDDAPNAPTNPTLPRPPKVADDDSHAPRLTQLPHRIDWASEGQRLVEGNLIGLPNDIADAIDAAALVGVVKRAAKRLGLSARVLVIGLLARAVSGSDRHAERVYRAILAKAKTRDIAHAAETLGLTT